MLRLRVNLGLRAQRDEETQLEAVLDLKLFGKSLTDLLDEVLDHIGRESVCEGSLTAVVEVQINDERCLSIRTTSLHKAVGVLALDEEVLVKKIQELWLVLITDVPRTTAATSRHTGHTDLLTLVLRRPSCVEEIVKSTVDEGVRHSCRALTWGEAKSWGQFLRPLHRAYPAVDFSKN